jgi:hypothetical protein
MKDGDTNGDASEAAEETGPAEAYNPKLMDDIFVEMGTYRARSFFDTYAAKSHALPSFCSCGMEGMVRSRARCRD